MNLELEGKVAIVTGGGGGIGAAIAKAFVNEGASVVIADISLDAAQKVANSVGSTDIKVLAVKTDVTQKYEADNLASTTLKEFGKIDILVNGAAICPSTMFVNIEEEEWDRVNDINAKGVYLVIRAVVPYMIAAKHGKIVNISSISGKEGMAGESHYVASKFAVVGLTQALAKELAEHNINVNAVCPGLVETPMWKGFLDSLSKREGAPPEQIAGRFYEAIPLKRPQTPDDIANIILFLSSEVARNITGEAVNITGGWRMD